MATEVLCEKFAWSADSELRNALTAQYEPVQPFVLLAMARRLRNAVFIDAGANIGFYTVVIGSEQTVAEVFTFEPMPQAVEAVQWNVQANLSHKPVEIRELALSDHSGQLHFAVRGPLAGDNGALEDSVLDRAGVAVETVDCARLDDVVSTTGREVVIKVDVEGHELSLLRGATRTLRDNRGFLQIEIHDSPSYTETVELIMSLGWQLLGRVGPDHYFTNMPQYGDGAASFAALLEEGLKLLLDESKTGPRASRRRLMSGVYLQISRRKVNAIKRVIRR